MSPVISTMLPRGHFPPCRASPKAVRFAPAYHKDREAFHVVFVRSSASVPALLKTGVRTYVVNGRCNGKPFRIALGPVGTLAFEGPSRCIPAPPELAKTALNAARRGEDPKSRPSARPSKPRARPMAELWKAYGDAGLAAAGIPHRHQARPPRSKADAGRWRKRIHPHR